MANILIVEDDESLRKLLTMWLRRTHTVTAAASAEEGLEILSEKKMDLIVTDIMMPGMDGYEFVETVRSRGSTVPVIILTAKGEMADKGKGFEVGTDDYMTKPVDLDELNWRISALLRRSKIADEGKITIGDVTVDSRSFSVRRDGGEEIDLPQKEFRLLFLLLSYPDRIFTLEAILDEVWGMSSESDEYTVRTHVNRLRNRLEGFPEIEIVTVRGIGYKAVIKA